MSDGSGGLAASQGDEVWSGKEETGNTAKKSNGCETEIMMIDEVKNPNRFAF